MFNDVRNYHKAIYYVNCLWCRRRNRSHKLLITWRNKMFRSSNQTTRR